MRLPAFEERNRGVAAALGSPSPAASLMEALRGLMLVSGASTSSMSPVAMDALLLALAGGALEAPPFRDCKPSEAGDECAIAIDLAAMERDGVASPAGGWQRLVFAPPDLQALIDEMLERLLGRGAVAEAMADEVDSADEPVSLPAPSMAPVFARRETAAASSEAVHWPDPNKAQDPGSAAMPRAMHASLPHHVAPSAAALRIASTPLGAARAPRTVKPADSRVDAEQPQRPEAPRDPATAEAHPFRLQGHATKTGAITRAASTANPLRARWQLHRTPSTPSAAPAPATPIARESEAPTRAFTHHGERATQAASPTPAWSDQAEQPAKSAIAQAHTPAPLAHPDPLAEIARAMASECDLRGLAP
ncbi:hypothetical protein LJR175_006668 [Variovorax sp. LjRoot175]|uniref:hypothetical protein n=2 Tax=unclassified Variovorax TaxID=663243 RepID=UPI003ED061CF